MTWLTKYLIANTASSAPMKAPASTAPTMPTPSLCAMDAASAPDERTREQLALDGDVDDAGPLADDAGQRAEDERHRADERVLQQPNRSTDCAPAPLSAQQKNETTTASTVTPEHPAHRASVGSRG